MRLKPGFLTALLGALVLTGCGDESSTATTPEKMTRGSDLYNYYCRHCHSIRGPGELLENRDPSRPPLKHHQLMVLMQFGDDERHRGQPTFQDNDPAQLQRIADYVVQLTAPAEDASTTAPAREKKSP